MGKRSPRVDEYIAKAADFAKPILEHVRELVHKGCPEVEETIKWGMPSFEYKGPFFGIASFKEHCSIGFWKASLLKDPKHYLSPRANQGGEAMGNFGKIKSLKDLPPKAAMIDFIKQAKKLNDDGIKVPRKPKKVGKPLVVPTYIISAIKSNKKALATFNAFSPSNKKEYVSWVAEAKTEPTREKRLKTAIQWMAEGKIRNWKYLKK